MKKIFSILVLVFMTSPFLLTFAESAAAKGEFKKEIVDTTGEGDELAVIMLKAGLYIGFSIGALLLIPKGTRTWGFVTLGGFSLALGAIVLFTDVFTTPMDDLSTKKKAADFFQKK